MSDTWTNVITRLGLLGLAKGATAAAQATVTTVDADHNALDVTVKGTPALAADAATATLQGTGNTSAATTATNTTTIAGAVSAPDATLPASAAQIGGVASTAAPTAVTSGRGVRAWLTLVGAQMVGLLGANGTSIATAANPVPIGGIDGSGRAVPLLTSAAGNMQTAPAKGTTVSSSAAEASHVISASACLVAKIRGYNGNAGVRYFQGHNASSLPGNGAVPSVVSEQATSAHAQEVNFAIPTDRFSTGCVVATSSTGATLTIGSADATFTVDLFPANA